MLLFIEALYVNLKKNSLTSFMYHGFKFIKSGVSYLKRVLGRLIY